MSFESHQLNLLCWGLQRRFRRSMKSKLIQPDGIVSRLFMKVSIKTVLRYRHSMKYGWNRRLKLRLLANLLILPLACSQTEFASREFSFRGQARTTDI